jgi:hypothetical protein
MSVSTQSKPTTSIVSDKWKIWRIINSATILFAFFIPWIVMLRDTTTHQEVADSGFQLLRWYQGATKFEALILARAWHDRLRVAILMIPYFLGLYTTLIYCILNILAAVSTIKFVGKRSWNTLVSCLFVVGIINLLYMVRVYNGTWTWDNLSLILPGYWLVWIGLASSTLLEISCSLKKKSKPETF